MGTEPMGRVLTEATIENLKDLWDAERGLLPPEKVRRITVSDALVDTGATVYDVVRLTIQDRDCPVEVVEVPDEVPVLIGQLPLENLDLVVDLQGRRLTGNPAHGGEQVFELY
jgi:hypothetical protein